MFDSTPFATTPDGISFTWRSLYGGGMQGAGLGEDGERFFPLFGWNLNLIKQFTLDPHAFLGFNALCFIVTSIFFYLLTSKNGVSKYLILFLYALVILTPGYSRIITNIEYQETTQIPFLMIFFYFSYLFYESSKNTESSNVKNYIYASIALFFGTCALYLKEITFIIVGGLAFFHIVFSILDIKLKNTHFNTKDIFQNLNKKHLIFNILVVLSALVYLCLFVISTRFLYVGDREFINQLVSSTFRTIVVIVLTTPVPLIAIPSMMIYRFFNLMRIKTAPHAFWDSLLIVGFVYFVFLVVTNLTGLYYFLPAYLISCLYAAYFLKTHFDSIKKSIVFKLICAIIGFIMIFNVIPQGLHYFSVYKVQNKNYNQAFKFLADYSIENPGVSLYFDGFCRGKDKCVYHNVVYGSWFSVINRFYGGKNFDIKSNEPNGVDYELESDSAFTFLNSHDVTQPQSGDLIILTYMSFSKVNSEYIQDMQSKYELIFKTDSFGYIPHYNLMGLGAWILNQAGIKNPIYNRVGENPFRLPSQVYVYKVP